MTDALIAVFAVIGAVGTTGSLLFAALFMTPGRYNHFISGWNGEQPSLVRMVQHQGRVTLAAAMSSSFSLTALILSMAT